ncbi:hypothetical protein AAT19DRAFT_11377 [Rhodotorula toruloides]|uniref:Uncharacterized protein n=1 Tax=Rhodotorula toruloides TaxID=5286 RepID=A0A2S9ZWL5_RHOTO|nr:hypothetical protein AAT19DRAFT_11377 [Rhodotorula toruloides]
MGASRMEQPPFAARRVPSPARQAVGRVVAAHEVVSTILWNEGSKIGRLRGRRFAQIANVTVGVEEEETKRRVSKRGDRISLGLVRVCCKKQRAAGEEPASSESLFLRRRTLGEYASRKKKRRQRVEGNRPADEAVSHRSERVKEHYVRGLDGPGVPPVCRYRAWAASSGC